LLIANDDDDDDDVGCINQISYLSLFALEIFQNLTLLTEDVHERIKVISIRTNGIIYKGMKRVEKTISAATTTTASISKDTRHHGYWISRQMTTPSIFTKITNYSSITQQYSYCKLPPQIWRIELLTGQDCFKDYSYPGYFFEEWLKSEIKKQYLKKMNRKKNKQLKKQLRHERKVLEHHHQRSDGYYDEGDDHDPFDSDHPVDHDNQDGDDQDDLGMHEFQMMDNNNNNSSPSEKFHKSKTKSILIKIDRKKEPDSSNKLTLDDDDDDEKEGEERVKVKKEKVKSKGPPAALEAISTQKAAHAAKKMFKKLLFKTKTKSRKKNGDDDGGDVDGDAIDGDGTLGDGDNDVVNAVTEEGKVGVDKGNVETDAVDHYNDVDDDNGNGDDDDRFNPTQHSSHTLVRGNDTDATLLRDNLMSFDIPIIKQSQQSLKSMKVGNHRFLTTHDNKRDGGDSKKMVAKKKKNKNRGNDRLEHDVDDSVVGSSNNIVSDEAEFMRRNSVVDNDAYDIVGNHHHHLIQNKIKRTSLMIHNPSSTVYRIADADNIDIDNVDLHDDEDHDGHGGDLMDGDHHSHTSAEQSRKERRHSRRLSSRFEDYEQSRSQDILNALQTAILTEEDKASIMNESNRATAVIIGEGAHSYNDDDGDDGDDDGRDKVNMRRHSLTDNSFESHDFDSSILDEYNVGSDVLDELDDGHPSDNDNTESIMDDPEDDPEDVDHHDDDGDDEDDGEDDDYDEYTPPSTETSPPPSDEDDDDDMTMDFSVPSSDLSKSKIDRKREAPAPPPMKDNRRASIRANGVAHQGPSKRLSIKEILPPPPSKQQITAPPPPSKQQITAPPPPSKQQNTAPPPPSKQQITAPPPPSKQQNTAPPPPSKQQNTAPPPPSKQQITAPPPPSKQQNTAPPPPSKQQITAPPPPFKQQITAPPPPPKPTATHSNQYAPTPPPSRRMSIQRKQRNSFTLEPFSNERRQSLTRVNNNNSNISNGNGNNINNMNIAPAPPPPPTQRKTNIVQLDNNIVDMRIVEQKGSLLQSIQLGAVTLKSTVNRAPQPALPKTVKVEIMYLPTALLIVFTMMGNNTIMIQ